MSRSYYLSATVLIAAMIGLAAWLLPQIASDAPDTSVVAIVAGGGAIIALTYANLALSVFKFRLLTADAPPFSAVLFSTSAGALLGQIMPVPVAVALARGWQAKLTGASATRFAASSLHEQVFDLLTAAAAALAGIAFISWGGVPALILFGVAMIIMIFAGQMILGMVARMTRPHPRISEWFDGAARLPQAIIRQLLAASALRYLMGLSRALVVLWLCGLAYTAPAVTAAYPLLQFAIVIPLSPGGLGVVEAGWTGVLTLAGAALGQAAFFAIALRIAALIAQACVLVLSFAQMKLRAPA